MSDKSDSSDSSGSPPPMVPDPTPEEIAENVIRRGVMPDTPGWDWKPFLTAVFSRIGSEEDIPGPWPLITDSELEDDDDDKTDSDDEVIKGPVPTVGNTTGDILKPVKWTPPKKKPDEGSSWDYVWYIPEWTSPDFDPSYKMHPSGKRKKVHVQRDMITQLRPAMRAEDVARNPTPYAQRWGIHMDELGGRSRLSPTSSTTRPINVDDQSLLGQLDPHNVNLLTQKTKELVAAGQIPVPVGDVAPEVFAQWKRENDIVDPDFIRNGVGNTGFPFETFVNTLPANSKQVYEGVLQDMLDDQDWQRWVFRDMTTDEMIKNNIYTLSNNYTCDLSGPLHPLIDLNMWEDTDFRGATQQHQRYLYQLGGKRMEWDPLRNDDLWQALQPALQMVSRVLYSNPKVWRAVKDLRTRQPVAAALDKRDLTKLPPETPEFLTKMCPINDVDISLCWEPIQKLEQAGYDFVGNVDKVLQKNLCISIESGYCDTSTGEFSKEFVWGRTGIHSCGADSQIYLTLSPEMMWPLLASEYSLSEKLSTSFHIASTLLHELMMAITFLTGPEDALRPAGEDPAIVALLKEYGKTIDNKIESGEPYYHKDIYAELGYAIEQDMWGFTPGGALDHHMASRHVSTLTLLVIGNRQPVSARMNDSFLLHGPMPAEEWEAPIPIDFYERFFLQDFWDFEHAKWGSIAYRRRDPDCKTLTLMTPMSVKKSLVKTILGDETFEFCKAVQDYLSSKGNRILSLYLMYTMWEVIGSPLMADRWARDGASWTVMDNKITRKVDEAVQLLPQAKSATACLRSPSKHAAYADWLKEGGNPPPGMTVDSWWEALYDMWKAIFEDGGEYFRIYEDIHRMLRSEQGVMERVVFEILEIPQSMRPLIDKRRREGNPITIVRMRLENFIRLSELIGQQINSLMLLRELAADQHLWEAWRVRFAHLCFDFDRLLTIMTSLRKLDDVESDRAQARLMLSTVPTSKMKSRSQRMRKMAMREYQMTDPAIRDAIEEFHRRIRAIGPVDPLKVAIANNEEVRKAMEAWQMGAQAPDAKVTEADKKSKDKKGIFTVPTVVQYKRPIMFDDIQQIATGNGVIAPAPGTSTSVDTPIPAEDGTHVFGEAWNPGKVLGSKPPIRFNPSGPSGVSKTSATPGPGGSSNGKGWSQYMSNALQTAASGTSKFTDALQAHANVAQPFSTTGSNTTYSSNARPPRGRSLFKLGVASTNTITDDLERAQLAQLGPMTPWWKSP